MGSWTRRRPLYTYYLTTTRVRREPRRDRRSGRRSRLLLDKERDLAVGYVLPRLPARHHGDQLELVLGLHDQLLDLTAVDLGLDGLDVRLVLLQNLQAVARDGLDVDAVRRAGVDLVAQVRESALVQRLEDRHGVRHHRHTHETGRLLDRLLRRQRRALGCRRGAERANADGGQESKRALHRVVYVCV